MATHRWWQSQALINILQGPFSLELRISLAEGVFCVPAATITTYCRILLHLILDVWARF